MVQPHPSFTAFGIVHTCHQAEVSRVLPSIMQRCLAVAEGQGISVVCGYNMTLSFDPATMMVTFKAGVKTETLGQSVGEVEAFEVPAHIGLTELVMGSYDKIPQVIRAQRQWFIDQGIKPGKLAYYLYLNNPATTVEFDYQVMVVWSVD